ncbi:MAG: DUF362 domain-containing protein [Bacteroidales bacterium]|nr:DUF362 domain-containing protein [Bacteroidales bacterium]
MTTINRRNFIKSSVMGGVAVTFIGPVKAFTSFDQEPQLSSGVAITTGNNRADMTYRALQPYAKQIKQAIGNRRVVIKPNNVSTDIPLCATHADTIEGILEFLKSIRKLDNVIIAESAANGPTFDGFENYKYFDLGRKYPVKFVDLDQEGYEILHVFDERDFKPRPVRFSKILLSPGSYIISPTRFKTHDRTVVTLSLKNIIFGAPIKDAGFAFGKNRREGSRSDKSIVHGGGYRGINYNLYDLAPRLHPHLAVLDGFEGMEGNGPTGGTPVDHRVCVVSTDWLAADRVAVELMGIDFAIIGYLNYCAQTGLGVADLNKIEIIGESIKDHIKPYKLSTSIEKQLIWMKPAVG